MIGVGTFEMTDGLRFFFLDFSRNHSRFFIRFQRLDGRNGSVMVCLVSTVMAGVHASTRSRGATTGRPAGGIFIGNVGKGCSTFQTWLNDSMADPVFEETLGAARRRWRSATFTSVTARFRLITYHHIPLVMVHYFLNMKRLFHHVNHVVLEDMNLRAF
jgi:hypothetical protein